jgi:hypothetical protein
MYGFWFAVQEFADGSLQIVSHASELDENAEVAGRISARSGGVPIYVEPEQRDYPDGGLVVGYTKPEPRRASTAP